MYDQNRQFHAGRRHHHEGEPPHGHGPHFHRGEGRGRGRGHFGGAPGPDGRGGRVRRGEARFVLLDALRDGPKHGYEIIKSLEERSSGQYAPSPGTVYPTLEYLAELGLIRAEQEAERRVFHLTETGKTELEAHAEEVNAFWTGLAAPVLSPASRTEVGFLQEEMENLTKTVWRGARGAMERDDHETVRRLRQAIEQCRNEARNILAAVSALDSEQKS